MSSTADSHFPLLVIGPAWVGDMVIAHSLFQDLYRRDSAAVIDVLAPAWTLPLLARMPEVRRGVVMPLGHGELDLATRWRLGRVLHQQGYRRAIVLPGSWKAALAPFAATIPRRTGFIGEFRYGLLNDARRLDKTRLPRTVDRFLALAGEPDEPLPPAPRPHLRTDPVTARQALDKLVIAYPEAPLLALCPGAEYGPAKRWPGEHFAALARQRLAAGWAVWLFGSAKDVPVTQTIAAAAPGVVDLAGRTDLGEAVDLLSLATAVVSNDSGLMHVAAALDRPLIALYGPSSPAMTPPLNPGSRVLQRDLPCSPCFGRDCPLGHQRCLVELSPTEVDAALAEALL